MAESMSSLVELGFSEYEARTYSGLVGRAPLTGYAIAKDTGVPQPKVYETLNRLAERGAVVRVGEDPAKWVAIPPPQLLAQLESEFQRRMATAELELSRVDARNDEPGRVRPYWEAGSWASIRAVAEQLIDNAQERLYLSAHADQLDELAPVILAADKRGARIDTLCFGEPPFALEHGAVVRHQSTEGTLYPHHQARHLALVADGAASLWALARSGTDWAGIWIENDDLMPAVVKGFVRHDLFVQRIYSDFDAELRARYGPSLERLVNPEPAPSPEEVPAPAESGGEADRGEGADSQPA